MPCPLLDVLGNDESGGSCCFVGHGGTGNRGVITETLKMSLIERETSHKNTAQGNAPDNLQYRKTQGNTLHTVNKPVKHLVAQTICQPIFKLCSVLTFLNSCYVCAWQLTYS